MIVEWLHEDTTDLAESTIKTYVGVIELHILKRIGETPIAAIDGPFVKRWQKSLADDGVTPDPRARALKYLRMLLNYAVSEGYLQGNPALAIKPPKIPAKMPIDPLSPRQVEAICNELDRAQDVIHVRLMAYAGLRPGEAVILQWGWVRERSLIVRADKTNRVDSVPLLEPLIEDLEAWRGLSPNTHKTDLVLPRRNGARWSKTAMDNWRDRTFFPACARAGVTANPKLLRHSFASLLIHAGYAPTDVAARMRHGLDMTLTNYSHVINDLDPLDRRSPEDAIRDAQLTTNGHALLV